MTLLQLKVDEGLIDNLKYLDDGLRQMKIIYRLKKSNSFTRFRICIKIFNVTARSNEVSLIQQPHEKGTAMKVLQQKKKQDQARNASWSFLDLSSAARFSRNEKQKIGTFSVKDFITFGSFRAAFGNKWHQSIVRAERYKIPLGSFQPFHLPLLRMS